MRAIAHPARVRILSLLLSGPLSASRIATLIGIAPGTASYHLGRLVSAGLVRSEDCPRSTGPGRPAECYRLVDRDLSNLDRSRGRAAADEAMLVDLRRRFRCARGARLVADAEVFITPSDWDLIQQKCKELIDLVRECARPPDSSGVTTASFTIAAVEMDNRRTAPRRVPGMDT
jgi:predicted ArsR family transcriptional regulator